MAKVGAIKQLTGKHVKKDNCLKCGGGDWRRFPIVGIGASAGGLEAFTELLEHLPKNTGMGFVLVQHLEPQHESALAQILSRASLMPVREVTNNLAVEANHVYVIPPNRNLVIARGVLKLLPLQPSRMPIRSIDSFFESLAQDQQERAIGVVLSGTATDGTLGLEAIKGGGGITFAQDDSAKYDSMPRSAVGAGVVDFVLRPREIAKKIARIASHPLLVTKARETFLMERRDSATAFEVDQSLVPLAGSQLSRRRPGQAHAKTPVGENEVKKVLALLRNHSGVDFSLYKSTTLLRRIARRMLLNKKNTLVDYANFIRGNTHELDALYSDALISVTSFFRNPDTFETLKRSVFAKLQPRGEEPIRVWVLGCSTGQEPYSMAMAYVEAVEKAPRMRKLQVFATDLNDALLDKARYGLYAKSLVQDISPSRLRRFFVAEEGGYRVKKSLREMVVFARQDLISDPTFSRMDLVSCRNLLIYLEPSLQKKVIPTFHYALKPGGFLILGASESVGSFTELFEQVNKKHRIYSKRAAPTPALHLPTKAERGHARSLGLPLSAEPTLAEAPEGFRAEFNAQREADRVTVSQFAPPGVLINSDLQILQFRGATSAYLQLPPSGKPSFDVLKMAREGLMLPLRAALNKAKRENKPARKEDVRINENGTFRKVNIDVIPLRNLGERCFLILFEDAEWAARLDTVAMSREQTGGKGQRPRASENKGEAGRGVELERELSDPRAMARRARARAHAWPSTVQSGQQRIKVRRTGRDSPRARLDGRARRFCSRVGRGQRHWD